MDSKVKQHTKKILDQCQYPGTAKGSTNKENTRQILRLMWVYLGEEVGFKLLSEGGSERECMNLIRKSIPNSGSIQSKAITKLFDRFLSKLMKRYSLGYALYYKN